MLLKVQKILRFIPVVNFITLFIWLHVCKTNSRKPLYRLKCILFILLCCVVITILRIILARTVQLEIVNEIAYYISIYLYFAAISFTVVYDQEMIFKEQQENK